MRKMAGLLLMLFAASSVVGQQQTLKISEVVPVRDVRAAPITLPLCDGEGFVYFRQFLPPSGYGSWVRVTPKGEASRFDTPQEYAAENILDANPGPDGLYLLIQEVQGPKAAMTIKPESKLSAEDLAQVQQQETPKVHYLVVALDEHGQKESAQKLDIDFWPRRLAVFNSGNFLVTGDRQNGAGDTVPITVILDAHGRILRNIVFEHDVQAGDGKLTPIAGEKGPKEDPGKRRRLANSDFVLELSRSVLQRGDDGRIYLGRTGNDTAPVYAIRDSGQVERIAVSAPQRGVKLAGLLVSHGTLMLYYPLPKKNPNGPLPKVFSIWDLGTGERITEYLDESDELGYAPACYEPGKFMFLKATRNNGLELVTATPR